MTYRQKSLENTLFSLETGYYIKTFYYPQQKNPKNRMQQCCLISSRGGPTQNLQVCIFKELLEKKLIVKTHKIGACTFYIRYYQTYGKYF